MRCSSNQLVRGVWVGQERLVEAVVRNLVNIGGHHLVDQVVCLTLGKLRSGVGPIGRLDLLTGAHVKQRLVELLSHLVGCEVHILAVRHELSEGFFLQKKKQSGSCQQSRS